MINLFLFLFLHAHAETKIVQHRAQIDSQKIIEVRYSNSTWNRDPSKIDTGVIILRDSQSKKTLQIPLEETGPNSSIFSGTYSVNWGGEAIKPEIYVLDQKMEISEKALKKVSAQIESGEIKRKPMFYRKNGGANNDGVQTLQVFDTKEEMLQALEQVRLQSKSASAFDSSSITSSEFATAKAIMTTEDLKKFAEDNQKRKKNIQRRMVDRLREEQIEKDRIQSLKNAHRNLSKSEKEKAERQAGEFSEAGLDFYRSGSIPQAEENFRKSFDLDPTNSKPYFQYGLSLFKNSKFNEALVVFDITKQDKEFEKESIYYAGLCEYSLKEYENADQNFDHLEKMKDEQFSPLASFYEGIIAYELKEYDKAKSKFELALDTSKDPKLDEKSERYIEDINKAIEFASNKQKKVFLSATLGTMYDSNVLQQSTSAADQGSASSKGSLRYIMGVGAYYRPISNDKYEFGPKFRTDYVVTQTNSLTGFDPLSIQLSAPFAYKTTFQGKATKIDVKPGYELLYLGETGSGHPLKTLNGKYLEVAPTVVMKDTWFTTLSLLYRMDHFYPDADVGENADKITLRWTNTLIVNPAKTKSVVIDTAYTNNSAKDSNNSYKRYDLSALYITPIFRDDITIAVGPGIYSLTYSQPNTEHDFNTAINATMSKLLTERISGTILSSIVTSASNADSSKYNKWTLGVLFNADYGF